MLDSDGNGTLAGQLKVSTANSPSTTAHAALKPQLVLLVSAKLSVIWPEAIVHACPVPPLSPPECFNS